MNVLIVVVNYRSADLTIDALASVAGSELASVAPARVVVVDNESGDGSYERLSRAVTERNWGDWVTVLAAGRNGGFAYGNNVGLAYAREHWPAPRYVHLLNPDTVVRPGALRALVAFMDANPSVGIAGSRLEDPDGTPQRSAFRFPSALGELEGMARFGALSRLLSRWVVAPPIPTTAGPTDWVAGASMIIRREVFDAIGMLDDSYFMYYEEVDFILRAARAGWPCWYTPDSRVVHLVGQSSGVTDPRQQRRRRPAYWFESRRRYMVSHLGKQGAVFADLAFVTGYALRTLRRFVRREQDDTPEKFLSDFVRNSAVVKGFHA
jgi:N-acetylglucosaminyl-diphospho-decaprenol L-rhamnosyltransferase